MYVFPERGGDIPKPYLDAGKEFPLETIIPKCSGSLKDTNISGVTSAVQETSQSAAQVLEASGEVAKRTDELNGEIDQFLSVLNVSSLLSIIALLLLKVLSTYVSHTEAKRA